MRSLFNFGMVFALVDLIGSGLWARVPLSELTTRDIILARARIEQRISLGETALETGLPSLAESSFAKVLDALPQEDARRNGLRLKWVSCLLATGQLTVAKNELDKGGIPDSAAWKLRRAMLELGLGKFEAAGVLLDELDPEWLTTGDGTWLFYVQGILKWETGEIESGLQFMQKALDLAVSPAQRAQMELGIYQRRILTGPVKPVLLEELKKKTLAFRGQRAGVQFAQEYAMALHKLGQTDAALKVLEEHLALLSESEVKEREHLLLLVGLLSGKGAGRGLLALQELLQSGREREPMLLGLNLLVGSWPTSPVAREQWISFLGDLLETNPDHLLKGELLFLIAQAAFDENEIDVARESANAYLKGFPQAENISEALRLLASISLSSQPPQYRTAATFLSRLREKSTSQKERFSLGVLLADCFFLAGDYENSATLYDGAINEATDGFDTSILTFQHIQSLLLDGKLESAKEVLDRLKPQAKSLSEFRWRAEWNLITRMKGARRVEEAFSRVRDLIRDGTGSPNRGLPANLVFRLRWLEAHLALEVNQPSESAGLAGSLLEVLKGLPEDQLGARELETLQASSLLLLAQAFLAQGKHEEAHPFLELLRGEHSGTLFAQRSYLIEASFHYESDDLVKAQQLCVKLADDFPENPLAPIALMEAAQFAEKRGTENFFREALILLERLSKQYPEHELFFYARLHQGHLFRKLNQFGNAQQIYTNLINRFPVHPHIYLALLSNADCLMAQAGDDEARFAMAINLYERIFLREDLYLDVRVEAGFKLAHVHRQAEDLGSCKEVLGSVLDQFLLDPEVAKSQLGGSGRYWMSRTILELGALLEEGNRPQRMDEARSVYSLIEANNLPGRSLAKARIEKLRI